MKEQALDLNLALRAAKEAASAAAIVIKHYYRNRAEVTFKADQTPVTQADVESELEIKRVLKSYFPEHGYYGEESAIERPNADFLWLIDPMHRGELVLGVSSASEFGQIASAVLGSGAELNGATIKVSDADQLAQAIVSTGNIKTLSRGPRWAVLAQLLQSANRTRGYGDFYHYHLLAQGSLDLVIESDVNILDIAALTVIVREAGGVITDLNGAAIALDTTSILAGTPAMHALALRMFTL